MKKVTFTLTILLCAQFIFGQSLDYENQVIQEYKKERKSLNLSKKVVSDISGICDANVVTSNQQQGIAWDDCADQTYEGTIEFEAVDGDSYNVNSFNSEGIKLNDPSFGAYYGCYDSQTQGALPNSNADAPTLFFNVDVGTGDLSFQGASQWGEVYSVSNVVVNNTELNFSWTNDYGEGANVQLMRQDGQSWDSLLMPCIFDSMSDSLALVALYNACDGPNWHIAWDLNTPVREWYGVFIDPESCRVSGINMGQSPELDILGFRGNNLSGALPEEIGDLAELTSLDLSSNSLVGEIPTTIGNLTNLTFLNLSSNEFSGEVFPIVVNLVNLESLFLGSNTFSGQISPEIDNMQELRVITFSSNQIEGEIPASLGNLTNLRIFFGSLNKLEGELPSEIGQIPFLQQFSTWGNQFSGTIPSEFGNIPNLSNLNLDRNNLSGEIPASLGQLAVLNRLGLAFNQMEGNIPDGFSDLFVARLNDNNFSGLIPFTFAFDFTPSEINLSNNNFIGSIPSRFFGESQFQSLYFMNNDFSGCIDLLDDLCIKEFNSEIDSFSFNDSTYFTFFESGYNFEGNPKLAWEGAIQNACAGESQIGAPCNDGDPNTLNDGIDEDCNCSEESLSSKDIEELKSISVSPNPSFPGESINVSLELNNSIDANIRMLDPTGKTVLSKKLGTINNVTSFSLETKNLSSGLYFLQVVSKNGTASVKIAIL